MLSGSAEPDVLTRAAAVAHRFLAKPCDIAELGRGVTQASALGQASQAHVRHRAAAAATALTRPPALYGELSVLLATETAGMADVARLIERDIAFTARLLQLTNSAFVGLPRVVSRVEEAVSLLGLGVVNAIVLSSQALAAYRPAQPIAGFSFEALEYHAALVAAMARRLVASSPDRGAPLLALWGLPEPIMAAVVRHHHPGTPVQPGLDAAAAVYVADVLIAEQVPLWNTPAAAVDTEHLASRGVAEQLPFWRQLAAELAG